MTSRSTLLSLALALLLLTQPLSAAWQDCCCSIRVAAMSVTPSSKAVATKTAIGGCPRCRAKSSQPQEELPTASSIHRNCGCRSELKAVPMTARRNTYELPVLLALDRIRVWEAAERSVETPPVVGLVRVTSGRDIRLWHCSWLA